MATAQIRKSTGEPEIPERRHLLEASPQPWRHVKNDLHDKSEGSAKSQRSILSHDQQLDIGALPQTRTRQGRKGVGRCAKRRRIQHWPQRQDESRSGCGDAAGGKGGSQNHQSAARPFLGRLCRIFSRPRRATSGKSPATLSFKSRNKAGISSFEFRMPNAKVGGKISYR